MDKNLDIDKRYKYWRMRTLYSLYGGYAMFYITRKAFTFTAPVLIDKLHISLTEIGIISTVFYITYGLSKFISGMMSDKSHPRYIFALGLLGTAIVDILFGFTTSVVCFTVLYGFQAYFQGWGWPPCAKLLSRWYSRNERGRWWSIWNTSHNLGGALAPLLIAGIFLIFPGNWRLGMIIPGIMGVFVALWAFERIRHIPEKMGLPKVEDYRKDYTDRAPLSDKEKNIFKVFYKYILCNKFIWLMCISYTILYIQRMVFNDWGSIYLHEKGLSIPMSNTIMSAFEIGGFLGALAAGWISDLVFKGKRGQINVIYTSGIFLCILVFWLLNTNNIVVSVILMFFVGFFIYGPQFMIGLAAIELSHIEAAGTVTGFLGLCGYLGAAISGGPVGFTIQHYGWHALFGSLALLGILSMLCLLPTWNKVGFKS